MARPALLSADQILSAAEKQFAQTGYGETSLRQLISACNISTTAFYARFDSKESVFVALVDRLLADLYTRASSALPTASNPVQGIEVGVEVLVSTLKRHKKVTALAMSEGAAIPAIRKTVHGALAALALLIESRLQARDRTTSAEHRRAHAWAIVGALHLQIMRWAVFRTVTTVDLPDLLVNIASALVSDQSKGKNP